MIPTSPFDVKVTNGGLLTCHGCFQGVPVIIQGIQFLLILYALPLKGLDVVLQVHWLEPLGQLMYDWKELTMEFF